MPEEQKDQNSRFVTEEVLDLKLKAVVSAMTTRMVVAIAVGAGISNAQIPTSVTVGAVAAAVAWVPVKAAIAFFGRG